MYNHRLASLLVCLSVIATLGLVAGCLAGDPPEDPVAQVTAFRADFVAATCDWSSRCCDAGDFERAFGVVPTDEASCHDVFGLDVDAVIERVTYALRSGAVAFSPDAAVACLAYVRALPCGTDPELLLERGPCDDVLLGTRAPGDTCAGGSECYSGVGVNICEDGICKRIFAPTGGLGTACLVDYQCDQDTYCVDGRCRTGSPVGAACGAYDTPACARANCYNYVCPAPLRDGWHCGRSVECESGFCSREQECEPPRCDGV